MAEKISTQAVTNLIINKMNAAAYFEEKDAGRLKDNEVYIVEPDKQGESVDAFYKWLKERNYNMNNFRGLETIFPVVKLSPIKIDVIAEDATEMTGTAAPNVKVIFKGKTAISGSDGRWRLPATPDPNATEVTIQWVDYAGRTHTEKVFTSFKKYCIPNGIQIVTQSIAEKYKLNKPENLEFPRSVTQIEEKAFYNYTQITGASAPSCEYVGTKAFCSCSKLKSISLPACIDIGSDTFFQCYALTAVSLPACTRLGASAFYDCSSLTSVSLPQCANIGAGAFYGCTRLKTVILSERWTPNDNVYVPNTATVYNSDKTKKVDWYYKKWVNV